MKCPLCGKRLVKRDGEYGRFLGCSGYPSCNFKMNIASMEGESIEERLKYRKREKNFLEEKHNPLNCDECNGEDDASNFFNSLYHSLIDHGYLTTKQSECIEKNVEVFDIDEEREEYKYPIREQITSEELNELDKYDL